MRRGFTDKVSLRMNLKEEMGFEQSAQKPEKFSTEPRKE